jgi:hypothetical protein
VRLYVYLTKFRLCLMFAVAVGVRGFNFPGFACLGLSCCLWVSLETP